MNKEPKVGYFLDEEEKAIVEAIESKDYNIYESYLTPEALW